jgi:AcrR family transcriptional regulator
LSRTSVSDIARDADLTPAAVYAYFTGKEALFQAAVDADARALIDESREAVDGLPMPEGVAGMVAALGDRLPHHPLAARVLAGHEPDVIDRLVDEPAAGGRGVDVAPRRRGTRGARRCIAASLGMIHVALPADRARS